MAKKRLNTRERKKGAPKKRPVLSPAIVDAWAAALNVDDQDLAKFIPTRLDIGVGEALLGGSLTVEQISDYTGHAHDKVKQTLSSPVAMAWISRQIHQLFKHRAGIVDAALYQAAIRGDVPAIKLFYERMGQLNRVIQHQHQYSGGIKLDTLSDEDLRRVIRENQAKLPAEFRIVDQDTPGDDLQSPTDTGPEDESGAAPVLPAPTEETQEADTVS